MVLEFSGNFDEPLRGACLYELYIRLWPTSTVQGQAQEDTHFSYIFKFLLTTY